MTFTDGVIFALIAVVIFLLWERFHYRRRISELYDETIELTAQLARRFELRSHPAIRHLFSIDAILDDMADKLRSLRRAIRAANPDREGLQSTSEQHGFRNEESSGGQGSNDTEC